MNDMITRLRRQLDAAERDAERAREVLTMARDPQRLLAKDVRDAVEFAYREAGYSADRALRQVQAHRAILDAYEAEDNADRYGGCGDDCEWKAIGYAIRQLVSIYSDRDGFRAEWPA